MITLTVNSVDYEVNYTRLNLNSIENGLIELRSPKTGFRTWVGGEYLFLKFFVWNCKNADPIAEYTTLAGLVGSDCYLTLNSCSYVTTTGDDDPITFFILSCDPYYYEKTQWDVLNLTLKAKLRSREHYLYLVDDLGNYILTDDGQKIRFDL